MSQGVGGTHKMMIFHRHMCYLSTLRETIFLWNHKLLAGFDSGTFFIPLVKAGVEN